MSKPLAPRAFGFTFPLEAGRYIATLLGIDTISVGDPAFPTDSPVSTYGGVRLNLVTTDGIAFSKLVSRDDRDMPNRKVSPDDVLAGDLATLYNGTRVATVETACQPANISKVVGRKFNISIRTSAAGPRIYINGPA
jgi:hypothetical protein